MHQQLHYKSIRMAFHHPDFPGSQHAGGLDLEASGGDQILQLAASEAFDMAADCLNVEAASDSEADFELAVEAETDFDAAMNQVEVDASSNIADTTQAI